MKRCGSRLGRAALMVSGAVLLSIVAVAAPAMADIAVTPSEGVRGDSARMSLRVPNDRPTGYTTKVELYLPDAAPVAEVFPMSDPDWAPALTTRKLPAPLSLIHGATTTEVVSVVTWTRVTDPGTTPNPYQELAISLGPLPDVGQLVMTVVQTYSDGAVVRWGAPVAGANGAPAGGDTGVPAGPAPVLRLVPPAPGAASGDSHAPGGQAGGPAASSHAVAGSHADAGAWGLRGTALGVGLSVGMVVALVAAGLIFAYPRRRRPVEADAAADAAAADDSDGADGSDTDGSDRRGRTRLAGAPRATLR